MTVKRWADYTTEEIGQAIRECPIAILPLGAVEEHGPHLPLDTDNLAIGALSARIAEQIGCLLLPVLPYGQVWSLARFPGSLTISARTLEILLTELGQSLHQQGIRGLIFMSGHFGNVASMRAAARTLYETCPNLWVQTLAYPGLMELARDVVGSKTWHPSYIHADEIETSLLLELAGDRVQMNKATCEYPPIPGDFSVRGIRWDELGDRMSGVFGDAAAATREKGRILVQRLEEKMTQFIGDLKDRVMAEIGVNDD